MYNTKFITKSRKMMVFVLTLLLMLPTASAQKASLKTNLLYGATVTLNLAFEIGLGKKTSLEL